MKKQIATTLIAASMLASLCSCGNNTAAGTTAAETQAAEATAAQTEETAAETTEAATAAAETTVKETTAATTTTAAQTTATETEEEEEEEEDNTLYAAVGTGMKRPDDYKPEQRESSVSFNSADDFLNNLKDGELKDAISNEIDKAMKGLEKDGIKGVLKRDILVNVYCRNGYAGISLTLNDSNGPGYWSLKSGRAFVYDMFGNKKIENYSDLFFEGEEFVDDLNRLIQEHWYKEFMFEFENNEYYTAAENYEGYTGTPKYFRLDSIFLNKNSPFSDKYVNVRINLNDNDFSNKMVSSIYRDMSELFVDGEDTETLYDTYRQEFENVNAEEDGTSYILVKSVYHSDDEVAAINETLKKCERDYREFLASLEVGEGIFMPEDFTGIYSVGNYMILNTDVFATEPWDAVIDLDTGKFLEPQDLLGDNWHDMIDEKYQSVEFDKAWISNYYGNDEIGYFALVTLFKNGQTTYPVQASIDMPKE